MVLVSIIGGGGGKTDKGELANQKRQAALNTDVASLAENRNVSRVGKKAKDLVD